jgi:hypothetical protein
VKLPGVDDALIDPTKVRDYLLSSSHPIGRFKGAFFRSLGYSEGEWQRLERDLRSLAALGRAVRGAVSPYGQKYEVRGILRGPSGRTAALVTVWIVLTGEEAPRLVTAYPGADR